MGDYHLLMQFDINSPPSPIAKALSTAAGVAAWWSDRVSGDPGTRGSEFGVSFPGVPQPFTFEVGEASMERIVWRCGDFPPWWVGTTIRWDISPHPEGAGSRLLFSHRDFEPDNPVIPEITPTWAQIILRLKGYVETGTAQPFFVH